MGGLALSLGLLGLGFWLGVSAVISTAVLAYRKAVTGSLFPTARGAAMRAIPEVAVDFVGQREGVKLKAYQDSVGIWTIGYGHTGPGVKAGVTITLLNARDLLRQDLGVAAGRLAARVKADVIADLTDNQYAALLSFVFNVGANPSWSIWKVLNARQFDQVPIKLMQFVNAGGKKLQGLVNRRAAEVALWAQGEPGTVDEAPPSSQTRESDTPPTPLPTKPMTQSKTVWTGAATVAGGASVGFANLQNMVAPQAANSEFLQRLVGFLAIGIVAAGIAVMVFRWLDEKAKAR